MKATLYKLKEGYVLAYDNLTRESFIESWLSTGKSIICHKGKTRRVLTKSPDLSQLSEEDAKRIGWFDVNKYVSFLDTPESLDQYSYDMGVVHGFQEALEFTEDRRFEFNEFELGDLIRVAFLKHGHDSWVSIAKDVIQGLSQPKSWEVEYKEENGVYKILSILK